MKGEVEVRGGRIRGVERQGQWSFSGIPYASSPAGSGRWRPPGPVIGWTGVRVCDHFGPIAPQSPGLVELSLGGEPDEQAEDCLTLNVWTPEPDGGKRPVMVWIHGGSFVSGSGAGSLYRGGMLSREGDVVVVTLNYRLGVLGFLAHPALALPGQVWLDGEEWSGFGNWGLADQVAALHWVHEHIADFGGDPGNVTLFGESAGGMSVSALLGTPAARGLFHRAIVQSGPPYTYTAERAAERAEQVAAHLGVPLNRAALERVPVAELVKAAVELGAIVAARDDPALLMLPVVDGGLLPSAPEEAIANGSVSTVPLLTGTTRDESAFFAVGSPALNSLDEAGLLRWVMRVAPDQGMAEDLISSVGAARAGRGEPVSPRDLWVAIATEYVFRLPTVRLAEAHSGAAADGVGTYSYLFTWESPLFGGILGSCHALDIPFVFGTVHNPAVQTFAGGGEQAFELSARMREAWVMFARSGVPGEWPHWDPRTMPTRAFGPLPGGNGIEHQVERPRHEELEAMATVVNARPTTGSRAGR